MAVIGLQQREGLWITWLMGVNTCSRTAKAAHTADQLLRQQPEEPALCFQPEQQLTREESLPRSILPVAQKLLWKT